MYFNVKNLLLETEEWKKETDSIYKKLYNSFKDLIINEFIPNKTKLPPTRVLAKDLSLSRSTIIKAFDMLSFEKLIIAKKGSGYFVNYINSEKIEEETDKSYVYPKISKRAKLFKKHTYVNTDNFSKKNVAFRPGLPPLDIFPIDKWKQISNEYWREATPTNLSYAPSEGLESLRLNIMNYLRIYRNLDCDHNQIIITSGSLHSLYLIGNSLVNKGNQVVMENPTFPRAYNLFKSIKANVIPCNVDNEGIKVGDLNEEINPKLIYTTPSNQYPLGVKMSKDRRLELLNYASKKHSLIIEDDYDHEFSNWEHPIQSLFRLDKEKRVIYIGTFNKLLHPSLRIGYMIVPKYLINPIKSIYEQSSRFVPVHAQEILNKFIQKDYLNKHIRNVIETSTLRRNRFINQTKNILQIDSHYDGLHIIGKLKSEICDKKAHQDLLKNNVVAYPLSNYYITKKKEEGLVLGFSSVNEKVMKEKTDLMNQILT